MACWDLLLLEASVRSLTLRNILKLITQSSWVVIFFMSNLLILEYIYFLEPKTKARAMGMIAIIGILACAWQSELLSLIGSWLSFTARCVQKEGMLLCLFFFFSFFPINRMEDYVPVLWGFVCLFFLISEYPANPHISSFYGLEMTSIIDAL